MRTKSRAHSEGSTNSSSHKGDTMKPTKADVYQIITDRIISQLEAGTVPWRKPWTAKSQMPKNLISGKTYRGVNVFLLGCQNYESPFWLTYKQATDKGGKVRRGEKGSPCVFWSLIDIQDKETGDTKKLPFLRYYTVFNASQIEGLEEFQAPTAINDENSIPQEIIDNMQNPPVIKHGFTKACYIPALDEIRMPDQSKFTGTAEYFSTLFHEATHATLHQSRCNRKQTGTIQHGDENYAREELVAEMGAAFLCGITGISAPVIENQSSYIASWLKVFQGDTKLVVNAAGAAQKAVDFILNRNFTEPTPEGI